MNHRVFTMQAPYQRTCHHSRPSVTLPPTSTPTHLKLPSLPTLSPIQSVQRATDSAALWMPLLATGLPGSLLRRCRAR